MCLVQWLQGLAAMAALLALAYLLLSLTWRAWADPNHPLAARACVVGLALFVALALVSGNNDDPDLSWLANPRLLRGLRTADH